MGDRVLVANIGRTNAIGARRISHLTQAAVSYILYCFSVTLYLKATVVIYLPRMGAVVGVSRCLVVE